MFNDIQKYVILTDNNCSMNYNKPFIIIKDHNSNKDNSNDSNDNPNYFTDPHICLFTLSS